jgi:hypothetical protein
MVTLAVFGLLFGVGAIAGFIAAHQEQGGAMSMRGAVSLTCVVLFALGCGYAAWRGVQSIRTAATPATPREMRYWRVLALAAVVGAVIALLSMLGQGSTKPHPAQLVSGPLSPAVAISLALLWGVVIPALTAYWHLRAIDEQEAAAWNKGALFALYAYWFVTPVWWLLWRAGLIDAPDGMVIFLGTMLIATIGWFWAKYR